MQSPQSKSEHSENAHDVKQLVINAAWSSGILTQTQQGQTFVGIGRIRCSCLYHYSCAITGQTVDFSAVLNVTSECYVGAITCLLQIYQGLSVFQ